MFAKPLFVSGLLAIACAQSALADEVFYNPGNTASETGKTTGYELFNTIGCPGQGLFESGCAIEVQTAPAVEAKVEPASEPIQVVQAPMAPAIEPVQAVQVAVEPAPAPKAVEVAKLDQLGAGMQPCMMPFAFSPIAENPWLKN